MEITNDSYASPIIEQNGNGTWNSYPGLTIRQEFAARLMSGMLANEHSNYLKTKYIADMAVRAADELIAELNKPI
jgi:hypothetical protein